jgi:hypothetical protein
MTIKDLKEKIDGLQDTANVCYISPDGEEKDLEFYGWKWEADSSEFDKSKVEVITLMSNADGWINMTDE